MLPKLLTGSYERYKKDKDTFKTVRSITPSEPARFSSLSLSAHLALSAHTSPAELTSDLTAACGYTATSSQRPEQLLSELPTTISSPNISTLAERLRSQAAKKREMKKIPASKSSQPLGQSGASAGSLSEMPIITYSVGTQEIIRQAEAIARNSKVSIPNIMAHILDRTIRARKRCTVFFQTSGADDGQSTDSHLHFIGILEQALKILNLEAVVRHQTAKATPTGGGSSANDELSNRFGELEVEDIDDIIGDTLPPPECNTKAKNSAKGQAVVVYEQETDPSINRVFRVFCFFEDLHRIEKFLRDTWTKYKLGELDLITAAMITDAAFDIAHCEETRVTSFVFPGSAAGVKVPLSYEKLVEMLFKADSSAQDGRPELISHINSRLTPFDEFIYMQVARTLAKNPALFITHRHHKMESDDRLLTQLLMDFSLCDDTREKALPTILGDPVLKAIGKRKEVVQQVADILTQGRSKLLKDGEINVWLVFGHQILLDIHDNLGAKVSQGWSSLQEQVSEQSSTIDYKFDREASRLRLPAERKDAVLRYTRVQNIGSPSHEITSSFQGLGPTQTEVQKSSQAMAGLILTEPSRELNFIFVHDPIYCGFEAFRFAVYFEMLGLALVKHHPGLFLVFHIYIVCLQNDLLSIRWVPLEEMIEQHIGVLFAGELPKQLSNVSNESTYKPSIGNFRTYFSQEISMQQCLYQLEMLSQSASTGSGKEVSQKQVTPLQLLSHIQSYLPTNFKALNINYINLREMNIEHPLIAPQDGGVETGFIGMTSEIFLEADGIQDCQEDLFRREVRGAMGPIKGGRQLQIAGTVLFEEILSEALEKSWART
ncbi:hypothetical protein N431DRAFT_520307 [Stipitochalara longipes BDJ]|nr:hypothetical protein N431DRAFT_520307 [Stipitochalara longipes BDJ]